MAFRSSREIESARGDGTKAPRPVELPLIPLARKSLHAAADLPAGHVLVRGDLVALRPGDGISPVRLGLIIGRKLRRAIDEGDRLEEDHFD